MGQLVIELRDDEISWIEQLAILSGLTTSEFILKSITEVTDPDSHRQKPKSYDKGLFDAFWRAYPRKVAKGSAERTWRRLRVTELKFKQIMEGLDRCKGEWEGVEKEYIPHPSTWLNQSRWQDEVEEKTWAERRQHGGR